MKIGIVIPLKSKTVSKNWGVTCSNLYSTINSVDSQTDSSFRSVVVGHEQPDFLLGAGFQTEFVTFDAFPPPLLGANEQENQLNFEIDRCSKILKGIIYLSEIDSDITHWFALDADDLIRNDFVSKIKSYGSCDAFILNNGYFYFKNTGIINREFEFSAYCGSSAVLSKSLFHIDNVITKGSFREMPFGAVSHVNMESFLKEKGLKVVVPKEHIIMYVRDNGENISNAAYCNTWYKKFKKSIKSLIRYQFSAGSIKRSFSL